MKILCEKEAFLKEINTAQEVISNKKNTSIFSNVLLAAQGALLTIRATDTKVTFETSIDRKSVV